MKDYKYTPLIVMGAVAEAISPTSACGLKQPQSTDLIVYCEYHVRACDALTVGPCIMCRRSCNLGAMSNHTRYFGNLL